MRMNFRFAPKQEATDKRAYLVIAGDGEPYRIEIKRHGSARRYTIRVREATRDIVLTMPPRGKLSRARSFAERNVAWITMRLKRLPGPVPFADGQTIPLRGVPHRIVHRPQARGTVWTEQTPDGALLCVAGKTSHVARRIRDYLKQEARRDFQAASRHYAATLDVTIRSISIRDTASRWGSCSYNGALSFSWRIILAPPLVLDYLAAHEVAHRIELNHSKRYWKVVDSIFAERARAEKWLRTQGTSLHRYGASALAPAE